MSHESCTFCHIVISDISMGFIHSYYSGLLHWHWGNHVIFLVPALYSNTPLQWRHNGRDSISNHQPHDCLLNRLLRRRSRKTSKLPVTGLCVGNSPGTGEFPAQMASYGENVSIFPFDDIIISQTPTNHNLAWTICITLELNWMTPFWVEEHHMKSNSQH